MHRGHLPLNALKAFEASARHLSLTKAADELNVTQAAVSQQVKSIENFLGCNLFIRGPGKLFLTVEGETLLPILNKSFNEISDGIKLVKNELSHQTINIGVDAAFPAGCLIKEMDIFHKLHPLIDLRLFSHHYDGLSIKGSMDYGIYFGSGEWADLYSQHLFDTPLTPVCSPEIANKINHPGDLCNINLLRTFQGEEWLSWFNSVGYRQPNSKNFTMIFDSYIAMAEAAIAGLGVALIPPCLFLEHLENGKLVQPFESKINLGGFWLTRKRSKVETQAMLKFSDWILSSTLKFRGD